MVNNQIHFRFSIFTFTNKHGCPNKTNFQGNINHILKGQKALNQLFIDGGSFNRTWIPFSQGELEWADVFTIFSDLLLLGNFIAAAADGVPHQ